MWETSLKIMLGGWVDNEQFSRKFQWIFLSGKSFLGLFPYTFSKIIFRKNILIPACEHQQYHLFSIFFVFVFVQNINTGKLQVRKIIKANTKSEIRNTTIRDLDLDMSCYKINMLLMYFMQIVHLSVPFFDLMLMWLELNFYVKSSKKTDNFLTFFFCHINIGYKEIDFPHTMDNAMKTF